ncbi:MotE family protein [Sulfitobacter donghicola]|uniref:Magnesium transporter MgtE intracellular domain-containing protein n=1 Tax=Sulfitobacter donghicola DSW-25 = KCTC 12864 = JCM 14565 TaxID=1300350 RepID=A0A073IJT2_9RHOB|nr:hypothetical protein [Sulfitobacter donghicola]KEJ90543.1 hypothetical protein DSW25_01095 [Sulfitobacter donghicola DSW-25 = KCTC 12864 = JCM 14565]
MKLFSLKKMMPTAGRGSVMIISALLLGSASIRVLSTASSAFAKEGQLPTAALASPAAETTEKEVETEKPNELNPGSKTESPSDVSALLKALQEREALVLKRERQLELRKKALAVADIEIEKRLKALSETEQNLRATLSLADEASEKDLLKLTAVYESMKPKDAAILFEEMEANFAAGFVGRMRPDAAAQLMAGLSPKAAYSISVILAGRNAEVPKD